jgi:diguanylate cyclase (GGDEF)-like protein
MFRHLREMMTGMEQRRPLLFGVLVLFSVTASIRLCEFVLTPLVFYSSGDAVCWPTDGILLAVLLMSRRRWWPWIAAGFVLDQLIFSQFTLIGRVVDSALNLLELLVAALFLPPFRTMTAWLRRPRLIPRFLIGALVLAPLCAALLGGFYFRFIDAPKTYWGIVQKWVSGDALGFALWTPLVLSLCSRETYAIFRRERLVQTLMLLTVTFLCTWLVFEQNGYPIIFLLFPILVVVVNALGFPGAVLSVNGMTIIAASATIHGSGPFMLVQGPYAANRILVLQLYLITSVVMSFTTSLTSLERQAFEERLRQALRKMELLAKIDALTELGNRRLFDLTLDSEWRRAYRDRTTVSLLLIDADEFKQYNDRYGHLAGDECLRRIADTLSGTIQRAGDLVARYGGEEFVALLPGTRLDQAAGVAENVRQQIAALRMTDEGDEQCCVTVSIGCSAVVPRDGLKPEALILAADQALYAAKQRGRNCVELGEVVGADAGDFVPSS